MNHNSKFASAERSSFEDLKLESDKILVMPHVTSMLNAISSISIILNKNRQIVFVNQNFLDLMRVDSIETVLGARPGEAVGCIHATEEPGGCGTSESCQVCGAVKAILHAQQKREKVTYETRITSENNKEVAAWDLNITASPMQLEGEEYIILSIDDISQVKRRASLERVFFHDLHNSVGGINGLMNVVKQLPDKNNAQDLIDLSVNLSHEALDEIISYQHFIQAEKGDFEMQPVELSVRELIQETTNRIKFHKVARERKLVIDESTITESIVTDKILLSRTLMNLIKNALEATSKGGTVRVGADQQKPGHILFWVHNQTVIDKKVKLQIFQRSFSTKGSNRGVGTYSIKLFVENYMKGTVWFESNESEGTTFKVDLPQGI